MRIGTVALVVALALAVLPTPAPARVPSGPLSIHVEAVLAEPTSVGVRTVFPFNGTAVFTSILIEGGESHEDTTGVWDELKLDPAPSEHHGPVEFGGDASGVLGTTTFVCTGTVDDGGNGSGRCAISGEFKGGGTWAGRIDVEVRSLVLDMHLHVVCPRCVQR